MNENGSRTGDVIDTVVVHHWPDVEVCFFIALMSFRRVREALAKALSQKRGQSVRIMERFKVEFISSASDPRKLPRTPNRLYFDVGGDLAEDGKLDQHGDPRNIADSNVASINMLMELVDLTDYRPWIRAIVDLVSANDTRGTRVSRDPFNIREVINGLNLMYSGDESRIFEWTTLAFRGAFASAKAGTSNKDLLGRQSLVSGVSLSDPEQSIWFQEELGMALGRIKAEFAQAVNIVRLAMGDADNRLLVADVPNYGDARVLRMFSPNTKGGTASRTFDLKQAGRDPQVVLQCSRPGHYQIYVNQRKLSDGTKLWLDLGVVAMLLRMAEARRRKLHLALDQDLAGSGVVYTTDGQIILPFLPHFRTAILHGSNTAPDVEPTTLSSNQVMEALAQGLPYCDVWIQKPDDEVRRQILNPNFIEHNVDRSMRKILSA